jgi:hypothetical protein
MYGPLNENAEWRIRYNQELYQVYNGPSIVKMAKSARLRWLRHLYRCEKSNPCKKLTFTKPEGVRKRGRPPVRWMDSVE